MKLEMTKEEFFGWLKIQSEDDQTRVMLLVMSVMDLGYTAASSCILAYNVFVESPQGMMSDNGTKH